MLSNLSAVDIMMEIDDEIPDPDNLPMDLGECLEGHSLAMVNKMDMTCLPGKCWMMGHMTYPALTQKRQITVDCVMCRLVRPGLPEEAYHTCRVCAHMAYIKDGNRCSRCSIRPMIADRTIMPSMLAADMADKLRQVFGERLSQLPNMTHAIKKYGKVPAYRAYCRVLQIINDQAGILTSSHARYRQPAGIWFAVLAGKL